MWTSPVADDEVSVEVYSGHTYAERPRAFTCRGRRYAVEAVEDTWRMPGGRGFLVRTETGERWELVYDEVQDRWLIHAVIEGDER